ncbi:Uncharacterized protein Adt_05401 [Abeliophyllum distichum]|uniref:Transposase (putative) gypsy type domain-containing protein n=1 Tax=Abeliophyllum distichum TaxID=126358 RepID=A0ABD1V3Z2_9LAMI
MRGSLDKRDASQPRRLTRSSGDRLPKRPWPIRGLLRGELEDIQLSYNIPVSVILRAPVPEERADDPPEGFIVIYEPAMQQRLRLPMHHFFHEVLRDWNLAIYQITPNGWGQMVASYLLLVVAEAGGNLTPREFESIYRSCQSASWYNVSPRSGQK